MPFEGTSFGPKAYKKNELKACSILSSNILIMFAISRNRRNAINNIENQKKKYYKRQKRTMFHITNFWYYIDL